MAGVRDPIVLVTGSTGLLGPFLLDAAGALGRPVGVARSDADVDADLTDADSVAALIGQLDPAIVFHAAALTDVDLCEIQPERADAANHAATQHLAASLPDSATLVVISTDQVYGNDPGPHEEPDVAPVNSYGATKLAGERAALARPGSLVLRTNFFGPSRTPGRSSISDFMIGRMRSGEPLDLFDDILFSPVLASTVAAVAVEGVQRGLEGVFNVASVGGMTKAAFGLAIAEHLGLTTEQARLVASTTLPDRAPRILDLRMATAKLEQALGRPAPALSDEIGRL